LKREKPDVIIKDIADILALVDKYIILMRIVSEKMVDSLFGMKNKC
jgi:hypothetical protein